MTPRVVTALMIGVIAGALLTTAAVGARGGLSLRLCPVPPVASQQAR